MPAQKEDVLKHSLLGSSEFLFESLCSESLLKKAFLAVRKNKGAPGVDRITIEQFQSNLNEEIARLYDDLVNWTYQPRPARRVEIPKPQGGTRNLSIPCVRDRVVQAALKSLLEPFFEPLFSERSFGFRPERNAQQAVKMAQSACQKGKDICVDIDLEKFFDKVHHDRLIARVATVIKDKRILRLIGITLRSGIMKQGVFQSTNTGTGQGSPLSPLLSNIVLDELDQELEKRGFEFCRYADDCNIFVSSNVAAKRAMINITEFIENRLKLKVNKDKSKIGKSVKIKFLGFTITRNGCIAISESSMKRAHDKLKDLIPRNKGESLQATLNRFNLWFRGWSNYYGITQFPSQFATIEAHARRRLRAKIIKMSKRPRTLFRKLIKLGTPYQLARRVFANTKCWGLSRSTPVHRGFSNDWFTKQGMYTVSFKEQEHWFPLYYRAWLT